MDQRCFFAQPLVNMVTHHTIAYELLMRQWDPDADRWQVPANFDVAPSQLCDMLTTAVAHLPISRVTLNLTAAQFTDPAYMLALTACAATHLSPRTFTIEITGNPGLKVMQQMAPAYRESGILLALDDVGSDNHYQDIEALLPCITIVKFAVQNLRRKGEPLSPAVIDDIKFWLGQADEHHLLFTLEGIEEEVEVQQAEALGALRMQGYYIARPALPAHFS